LVTKEYFPGIKERIKIKITQLHGIGDRTRENQSIPTSLQDNSVPGMYVHPWQLNSGSPHISLRQAGKGKRKHNRINSERRRLAGAKA
jgi:hypothetical protein